MLAQLGIVGGSIGQFRPTDDFKVAPPRLGFHDPQRQTAPQLPPKSGGGVYAPRHKIQLDCMNVGATGPVCVSETASAFGVEAIVHDDIEVDRWVETGITFSMSLHTP